MRTRRAGATAVRLHAGLALLGAALVAALAAAAEPAPPASPGAPPSDAAPSPAAPSPRPRALWVLCEGSARVLDRREALDALLADARALRASDLFVQVYRGGRAWFDSSLADATPWRATWRSEGSGGADALAALVERAHAQGLRVHAWVVVLSLAKNAQAPILRDLGAGAAAVDQWGRSILDYPGYDVPRSESRPYRLGTPAIFLDPAAPGVAERLAATFEELLRRYPALDGLHLDYVRYPDVLPFAPGTRFGVGLSFGYGAPSRARFRAETGIEAPFADRSENAERFDAWRRDQVTSLVARIGARARAARPGVQLSAAVFPESERAYLSVFQDWRRWLEEGLLDFAVPMLYSRDDRLVRYRVTELAGLAEAPRIWVGLGSWLFDDEPDGAAAQARLVEGRPPLGLAFFSWDSIHGSPGLRAALAGSPGAAAVASPPARGGAPAASPPAPPPPPREPAAVATPPAHHPASLEPAADRAPARPPAPDSAQPPP